MTTELEADIDMYPFAVRPLTEDEGGGYLCEFPDVPGCMGDGDTPEEAIKDGRAALRSCLETFRELGREVPLPLRASGQWRMRAPKSLHQRLAERASLEGVSLNTLAVSLLSEGLGLREGADREQELQRRLQRSSDQLRELFETIDARVRRLGSVQVRTASRGEGRIYYRKDKPFFRMDPKPERAWIGVRFFGVPEELVETVGKVNPRPDKAWTTIADVAKVDALMKVAAAAYESREPARGSVAA